jgi:hypothetical protein
MKFFGLMMFRKKPLVNGRILDRGVMVALSSLRRF